VVACAALVADALVPTVRAKPDERPASCLEPTFMSFSFRSSVKAEDALMPTHKESVMSKSRSFVAGAFALASVFASGVALANPSANVQWSVAVGTPVGIPVYAQPARNHVQPVPVYVQSYPAYPSSRRDYHSRSYQESTRWDRDGDGIPNRRDRLYNPRWDVDGDGISNQRDHDDRRHWGR
jgi:hypothetical protein